jgi:hypothetical protein
MKLTKTQLKKIIKEAIKRPYTGGPLDKLDPSAPPPMSPTAFGEKIKGVAVFLSGKYPQTDINNGRVTKDMLVMAASQEYDIDEDKATEVVNTLVDVGIVELTDDRVKTLLGVEVGFSDYMEPSRKGPVYGIPRLDGSIRHVDGYGNPNILRAVIEKEKPDAIKGEFIKSIYVTSSMGTSLKLSNKSI